MSGGAYCTNVSVGNSTGKRGRLKHFVDAAFSTTVDCGDFFALEGLELRVAVFVSRPGCMPGQPFASVFHPESH